MSDQDGTLDKNFFVGAFVAAGLALLIFFVVSIGGVSGWVTARKTVKVKFDYIGGLKAGQPVRYAGHKVGTVSSIQLAGDTSGTLLVTLSVQERTPVYHNSHVTIASSGLIGDKTVNILPPETPSDPVGSGDVLDGDEPISLTRILSDFGDLFDAQSGRSLSQLLDNANQTSKNLTTMSQSLRRLVEDNQDEVDTILTDLSSSSERLKGVLERADRTARTLEDLSAKLSTLTDENRPELEKILTNLKTASRNLKETSSDVKDNPSSLFWGK